METEEAEAGDMEDEDWLLRRLPALPCFPLVYRNLASSLRRACQVETDPATVSLYIRSVVENTSYICLNICLSSDFCLRPAPLLTMTPCLTGWRTWQTWCWTWPQSLWRGVECCPPSCPR